MRRVHPGCDKCDGFRTCSGKWSRDAQRRISLLAGVAPPDDYNIAPLVMAAEFNRRHSGREGMSQEVGVESGWGKMAVKESRPSFLLQAPDYLI